MVKEGKVRMTISMDKESANAINIFSDAMKMSKSEFVEDVCMAFIQDVAKKQAERRKKAKKGDA